MEELRLIFKEKYSSHINFFLDIQIDHRKKKNPYPCNHMIEYSKGAFKSELLSNPNPAYH